MKKFAESNNVCILHLQTETKFMATSLKTWEDLIKHPLIKDYQKNYDGKGVHMIICIDGYRFYKTATQEIGNVKQLIDAVRYDLDKYDEEEG